MTCGPGPSRRTRHTGKTARVIEPADSLAGAGLLPEVGLLVVGARSRRIAVRGAGRWRLSGAPTRGWLRSCASPGESGRRASTRGRSFDPMHGRRDGVKVLVGFGRPRTATRLTPGPRGVCGGSTKVAGNGQTGFGTLSASQRQGNPAGLADETATHGAGNGCSEAQWSASNTRNSREDGAAS
jgi:hypothetical protein